MAFFGPRPGMAVSARTPAGTLARSFSIAATEPVWRSSRILSAMDLPTLGISPSPFASRVAMSTGWPATARAAFSYARALNGASPPVMAIRSAYSCNSSATWSFARAMLPSLCHRWTSGYERHLVRGVVEPPAARLDAGDDVLYPHAEPAGQVDAGLDGEAHAGHQRTLLTLHHVRRLVCGQPDAVPGAVDEVLAVARVGDHLAR